MGKRLVLIFIGYVFLFVTGVASCGIDNCGSFPNRFKTVGVDWFNYSATYSDSSETRLILNPIENDSVDYDRYSILIMLRQETYFAENSHHGSFSLVTTAYACSPVAPKTDEKIDGIVITSTKDFDVNYPSGSDLSELFNVVVVDHSENVDDRNYSLADYMESNPFVPSELTLILREQPQLTTDFEFLVRLYLDGIDNDYFEFSTNSIVIKKE